MSRRAVVTSQTGKKRADLPPWNSGTDRQRGRALWRYLRERGRTPLLRRREARLQPESTYTKDGRLKISFYRDYKSAREVNSSMLTALSLAARGEFVAAGSVYYALMSRQCNETKKQAPVEKARIRRQVGAVKARRKRAIQAIHMERDVMSLALSSRKKISSEQIARKVGISASSVRRILKKHKDI
jgi:hypothetical protein